MMTPSYRYLLAFTLVSSLSATACAQFEGLVSRVPSDANVLVLIDVEKLEQSQLAQREGWHERHQRMFDAGLLVVPPKALQFVAAGRLELESMKSEWELNISKLSYDPSMTDVAIRYSGSVDQIQGRDVAVLPGNVYAVKLNKQLVASGFPASRQIVGRWLSRIYSSTPIVHSPYLQEAQKLAEAGAPMVFALDLDHAVSVDSVKQKLAEMKFDTKIELDAAAKAIASIRGVSLGVAVTDKRGGSLKIDFSENISAIKDIAKPLVLHVLEHRGVAISEFYDWDVVVGDKEIRLRGELFESGTRRILSLLEGPVVMDGQKPVESSSGDDTSNAKRVVYASQLYFASVNSLIDDLRDKKSNRQTMGQLSVWFDRYARKIDRLSVLHVDKDLTEYGAFVGDTLRQGSSSVTSAAADSRIQQTEVPEQYDTYSYSTPIGVVGNRWGGARVYGWGGWAAVPNNQRRGQLQSQIRTKYKIKGGLSANHVLAELDAVTADVRRAMTQRYEVDF